MSSSSPVGNPSIFRKAGSFSFSLNFSRKYCRRASSFGNLIPKHSTGCLEAASLSEPNILVWVVFAMSLVVSAFHQNLLTCGSFDLGSVDAAVSAILGRDDPVQVAIVFVPLPLVIP